MGPGGRGAREWRGGLGGQWLAARGARPGRLALRFAWLSRPPLDLRLSIPVVAVVYNPQFFRFPLRVLLAFHFLITC